MDHRALDTPDDLRARAGRDALSEHALALAVNMARAEVGRDALRIDGPADAEFGPRSWFHRMTKQFRSEKAKKQLRDPESKQFIEERGSLDIPGDGEAVRARVDLSPEEGDALSIPGQQGRKMLPAPKSSPKLPVERLEGERAVAELLKAGFVEDDVRFFRGRGVVFKVKTPPGGNPVFVFSAHPDGLVSRQSNIQLRELQKAKNQLAAFEKANAGFIAKGDKATLAAREQYRAKAVAAQEVLEERRKYLRSVYGSGGDEVIGKYDEGLAQEAGAILAGDFKNWPPWELARDGKPRPFMIAFDEGGLLGSGNAPDVSRAQQGLAPNGKSYYYLDRDAFRRPMSEFKGIGSIAPTDKDTVGQHALLHEAGHIQDDRKTKQPGTGAWDSAGTVFTPFIKDAMKEMYIEYGDPASSHHKGKDAAKGQGASQASAQREWFAEMLVFSRRAGDPGLTPQQQVLAAGFRNMFMLNRVSRAPNPSPAWVSANQVWLQQAIAAARSGAPLPRMPNPEDFFGKKYGLNVPKNFEDPW